MRQLLHKAAADVDELAGQHPEVASRARATRVLEANALPGAHRIEIPAGVYQLSIPGFSEDQSGSAILS